MKIDGVRVVAKHRGNCTGVLHLRKEYSADKRDGRTGFSHQWREFACIHLCGAEVHVRLDTICAFAADLMRQAEGR